MARDLPLAIPFHLNYEPWNSRVKEFNVLFDCSFNRANKMLEFCEKYKDKTINIQFKNFQMEIVSSICALKPNVKVRLTEEQIKYSRQLLEKNIPFFFDTEVAAYNISSLAFLIGQGVTDIYLADDLWYNLPTVHDYCAKHNVRIRMVLNTIPATTPDRGKNCKSPIFSPMDMEALKKFIDIFEFNLGDKPNWGLCNVLFRNWFERGYWNGQLNDINEDVQIDWPCNSVMPELVYYKLTCGRACEIRPNNSCKKCQQFYDIACNLRDKGIKIKKK